MAVRGVLASHHYCIASGDWQDITIEGSSLAWFSSISFFFLRVAPGATHIAFHSGFFVNGTLNRIGMKDFKE